MNEELYNIVSAFYSIGVNLGESRKAIPKKANELIQDYYQQILEHEKAWLYENNTNEESQPGARINIMEKLDYPNEYSCYFSMDIIRTYKDVCTFTQTKTKTIKRDLRDKKSKVLILNILRDVAIAHAEELNSHLLTPSETLNAENVSAAIADVVLITEIRQIIESIYLEQIKVQINEYINFKLNFAEELEENPYSKKMIKLLESEFKIVEKAKDLLQLVMAREKIELQVLKQYACYNVDKIILYQKDSLTRSQIKKLANYAKTIKKDINSKNNNTRFLVTKCHNTIIRSNYS